ncbi:MAG: aminotransferase class IV, partial [Clostridia bacterium]|nr:aminotransferase class IV [Clostridia bacterium]
GDGVYDVTYCRNYVPYCFDAHIDRFFSSAKLIDIEIPMTKKELKALLLDLIKKVDSPEQMMYWQVTRCTAMRQHDFPKGKQANIWVTLRPLTVKDMSNPVTLITAEDIRYQMCNIKTLNLIPNCLAEEKAKAAGATSAVFHRGDRVTECAHSNIHIIKNGTIITPPTDELILPGIGRANIIRLSKELGIPVEIRPFTVKEMFDADEVMMSSSTAFCMRVSHIDGKEVGFKDPETILKLQAALKKDYEDATRA